MDFTTFGIQDLTGSLSWTLLLFALWAAATLFFLVRVRRLHLPAIEQSVIQKVETPASVIA